MKWTLHHSKFVIEEVSFYHSLKVALFQISFYYTMKHGGMMTSSNGNTFRVTGHLCGEFTGPRWRSPVNSPHKGQWRRALVFSLICVWINGCINNCEAGDLRRYCAHYDVGVMDLDVMLLWLKWRQVNRSIRCNNKRFAHLCATGHNGRDGVSNHQSHHYSTAGLFRRRPKKISKLRVTVRGAGNSPVTGEFAAQRASNAENVSLWWRHHGNGDYLIIKIMISHRT